MAKRWQGLLNRGVPLVEVKVLILFYNYYLGTLTIGLSTEDGRLMEVELYNLQQENDKVNCN